MDLLMIFCGENIIILSSFFFLLFSFGEVVSSFRATHRVDGCRQCQMTTEYMSKPGERENEKDVREQS